MNPNAYGNRASGSVTVASPPFRAATASVPFVERQTDLP
jgi:hypothetical protein